jgi:hypothetical protein
VTVLGVIEVWFPEQILAIREYKYLCQQKEVRVVFKYHHIIMKLPGEYKHDFVTYDN